MNKTIDPKTLQRVFSYTFANIYPLYITKVERKGHSQVEVDQVICWLTGYDELSLQAQIENKSTLKEFFDQAPILNPNVSKITGSICGYKIQEITDPLMRNIRYMDKLVDEIAQGKSMDKILRD